MRAEIVITDSDLNQLYMIRNFLNKEGLEIRGEQGDVFEKYVFFVSWEVDEWQGVMAYK